MHHSLFVVPPATHLQSKSLPTLNNPNRQSHKLLTFSNNIVENKVQYLYPKYNEVKVQHSQMEIPKTKHLFIVLVDGR